MTTEKPKHPSRRKRSRQVRRTGATRQKLLSGARAVFAEKGLDLATIDDITERADVGKGTFYNHFKSKQGLISELIRTTLGELEAAIEAKCSDKVDLTSVLDSMIGVHIEFFASRWEDFVLYYQGRADLTLEEGYQGIETPFVDYLECIETLLDGVIKRRLSKRALRRIACAVAGFVSGYYSFVAIATDGEDVDETLRSLRGALVASLARFINAAMPEAEAETVTV